MQMESSVAAQQIVKLATLMETIAQNANQLIICNMIAQINIIIVFKLAHKIIIKIIQTLHKIAYTVL